jgi:hypothetical protein
VTLAETEVVVRLMLETPMSAVGGLLEAAAG